MEIINVAGYTHNEKRHILNKYLLPQAIKNSGILNSELSFRITDEVKDLLSRITAERQELDHLKSISIRLQKKLHIKWLRTQRVLKRLSLM